MSFLYRYVLTGTADELKSSRALKVIATAMAASLPLARIQVSSMEQQVAASTTKALNKYMALSISINHGQQQNYGGTSHLLMRILASHASPNLSGATDVDKAHVDAWMDFIWSAIDIPVEMLLLNIGSTSDAIQKELELALAIVESHLTYQTFMVRNGCVTIADVAMATALYTAASKGFWKPSGTTNLKRFYETIIHQEFWIKALEVHASTPENRT